LVCAHVELINSDIRVLQTVRRTPWTLDQLVTRPLPTQDNMNRTNAKSGIRTHDANVWEGEGALSLRSHSLVIAMLCQ
jgi:hypothetical protein